ncbi:Zinc finger, GRF-type [Sesbania bispinosa]|nr:Zinc finger, GRF-type [Sesbania bispinosa]
MVEETLWGEEAMAKSGVHEMCGGPRDYLSKSYQQRSESSGMRSSVGMKWGNSVTGLHDRASKMVCCWCGEKAICLTSRTRRNPGRRFFTCALGKRELRCGVFKWVDEVKESVVHTDEVQNLSLNSILASNVAKIERDVWLLKICFVVLTLVLTVGCVVMLLEF